MSTSKTARMVRCRCWSLPQLRRPLSGDYHMGGLSKWAALSLLKYELKGMIGGDPDSGFYTGTVYS